MKSMNRQQTIGFWLAIGMLFGLTIGNVWNASVLGVGIGAALGVLVGVLAGAETLTALPTRSLVAVNRMPRAFAS